MTTRDIRTSHETSNCDVCGRTLLRGEHADIYLNGGMRRLVCELCKTRALHEGWLREGTVPAYETAIPVGAPPLAARPAALARSRLRQRLPSRADTERPISTTTPGPSRVVAGSS